MKIEEVVVNEEFSLRKGLAALILAGSLGAGAVGAYQATHSNQISVQADPELTKIGRETLKDLPSALQKKIGDVDKIIFVKGIPKGGSQKAICQIGKGENIIYVNPKYVNQFLSGEGDQLSAHELTHYAQSRLSDAEQKKFPPTDSDESKMYGKMAEPDAWKVLQTLRSKGDRMWNHSREEQAMIVQQREAQYDIIRQLQKRSKTEDTLDQIKQEKQKISVYDEYINDFDSM